MPNVTTLLQLLPANSSDLFAFFRSFGEAHTTSFNKDALSTAAVHKCLEKTETETELSNGLRSVIRRYGHFLLAA